MNITNIQIGPFALEFFGILMGILFIKIAWTWYRSLQKQNLDTDFFVHHLWKWVLVGLLVGRVLAVLLEPNFWITFDAWRTLAFWIEGIDIWGFGLGFFAMMIWDLSHTDQNTKRWLDTLTFPLYYGLIGLNIIAFFTGYMYGLPTTMPWGIAFENTQVDIVGATHPVMIYSIFGLLLIFPWIKKRKKAWQEKHGKMFFHLLIVLLTITFLSHFFRADPSLYILGKIRIEQIWCIITLIALGLNIKKFK